MEEQRKRRKKNCSHRLQGVARVVLDVHADDLADHGVLAHEHRGGAAEREPDLGHLVRPHVVGLGGPRAVGGVPSER